MARLYAAVGNPRSDAAGRSSERYAHRPGAGTDCPDSDHAKPKGYAASIRVLSARESAIHDRFPACCFSRRKGTIERVCYESTFERFGEPGEAQCDTAYPCSQSVPASRFAARSTEQSPLISGNLLPGET